MTSVYKLSPTSPSLQTIYDLADTVKKIYRGGYVFNEGQQSTDIFLIKSGIVRLSKLNSNGLPLNLRICKTGDLIGDLTLFTDQSNYFLTAEAITPVEVYVVKREVVENAVSSNPILAKEFIIWFNTHFQKTQSKYRDLALYGKKGAVYSTLIRMTNMYGKTQPNGSVLLDLPLTNQDLANFCGYTSESIDFLLTDLIALGVISVSSGYITIKDIRYLQNEIQCEGCSKEICCFD